MYDDLGDASPAGSRAPRRLAGINAADRATQVGAVPGLLVEGLVEQGQQQGHLGMRGHRFLKTSWTGCVQFAASDTQTISWSLRANMQRLANAGCDQTVGRP